MTTEVILTVQIPDTSSPLCPWVPCSHVPDPLLHAAVRSCAELGMVLRAQGVLVASILRSARPRHPAFRIMAHGGDLYGLVEYVLTSGGYEPADRPWVIHRPLVA